MGEFIGSLDPVAVWGAALSTILAAREFHRTRLKLEIGFISTGDPDGHGHTLQLRNTCGKPIIITYWTLQWRKRIRLKSRLLDEISPDLDTRDILLKEHSSHVFNFVGENYFDWNRAANTQSIMFLKLHIAGRRKPIYLKIGT